MRPSAFIAAAVLAAAQWGCAVALMPTPVGHDQAGGDPFRRTPAGMRTPPLALHVATNRKPLPADPAGGPGDRGVRYGNDRSEALRLGTMQVAFEGVDGRWERLVEVSRADSRTSSPTVRLERIDEIGPLWTGPTGIDPDPALHAEASDRFARSVDAQLEACARKDVFVFLHGFNTTLDDNAALSAQLFHYLGRDGAFVQFEWPSRGSVWDYVADKSSADASVRTFRQFLWHLARRTRAERVHVLAHSAGAPIAVLAIQQLRLMAEGRPADEVRRTLRLGRVILVAPDMDLEEFRDAVADGATELPERLSVYVSSRDRALDMSAWMASFARLGRPLEALTPGQLEFLRRHANVDVIDVAEAERRLGSWLGHSYFHDDPWVSTDVLLALGTALGPAERGLRFDEGREVWAFGPDYPALARAAARRAVDGTAAAGD